jgi:ATP-dependent DNA helicase RecG
MLEITTLADIAALRENIEVECKLAAGKDGKGALPKDFWETYSAFANSYGGDILLGVRERKSHHFEVAGVEGTMKVLNDLWTCLNNPQKVSANLLTESMVQVLDIEGKTVVRVHVPRASRKRQPVFLRGNPLTGTYRRLNSSDCLVDEETVRRMLAEQVEDVRDNHVLNGFGIDELDLDSLHAYRNMLSAHKPDHPWTTLDDLHFLRSLGGWRHDRTSGSQGVTLAGLLMFGQWPAIQEAVPYYFVDFQEQPAGGTETRWLDRVVPDGTWSGNLFDFYRRVVRKLVPDLKVPFALKGDVRQDDTPVHRALREALVNTLVHADYTGRASVLVVKQPPGFIFRNPGRMRVPIEP